MTRRMKPESETRKDARTPVSKAPPKLTHRHFAYIAAVFKASGDEDAHSVFPKSHLDVRAFERAWLACGMADALARTNPRFDRARFLRACGVAP